MARILLTTLGSLGDLHPMLAVGLELKRRGHYAVLATTAHYRDKVESAGLGFRPIRPAFSPDDTAIMRRVMDLKKGPEFLIRKLLLPHLRETFEDLTEAAADADFMVAQEIVFAAPLVAEMRKLRWAAAILSPCSFLSPYDPSVIAPLPFAATLAKAPSWVNRGIIELGKASIESWGRPIERLRAELGLPQVKHPLFRGKFSPHRNLAMFPEELGPPQPDWPAATVQTGFVFYDQQQPGLAPSASLAAFLAGGERPIVFTLGSAAVFSAGDFYEQSAKAARILSRRALLIVGKNQAPAGLPDSIAAFDYAPFSQVFPHAACVVHQGGVGTTAQVLQAGCPQLVVPFGFDQPDNAARVERLGVARTIARTKYKAARVAAELRILMAEPGYRERAVGLGNQLRARDGLQSACDAIESCV